MHNEMYKPFKIAADFTTHYFNTCVPKNASYGRLTKNIYIFIDNYSQFRPNMQGIDSITINVLDARKDSNFHKCIIKKYIRNRKTNEMVQNPTFEFCYNFVAKNKLWNTKCENILRYNRSGALPSYYVKQREPKYRAYGDYSKSVGVNDDIRYKEITENAHYAYERASMSAEGTIAAQRFDIGNRLKNGVRYDD
jgi:hypothetical protein